MKEQIKELRVRIDGLAQLTKELKPIKSGWVGEPIPNTNKLGINSKEIEKAVDSLYLAKAWLGKVLGELGNENPYGSGYKTKEDIVPTQDVSAPIVIFEDFNHIEKVDWLRTEIEKVVNEVKEIPTKDLSREFAIARTNCFTHLSEARFYLGFELSRVKDEK